jgi:transglutaminase-like putative cysteine protease
MHIRFGFDISYDLPAPTAMVLLLHTRPEYGPQLRRPELLQYSSGQITEIFIDPFGNRATRLQAPAGPLRLTLESRCEVSGDRDATDPTAIQHEVSFLPADTLQFLLPSRYCETDRMGPLAWSRFGHIIGGWARVQAVCDYVHTHLRFDYQQARATRTAYEGWTERVGVCRDFTHLAITLCRCLNIPARYATGYLGDIGVPVDPAPMDFCAWFEVYIGGRWFTFDARHNRPRIGRIVMARGRDAADAALITTFGPHLLRGFKVIAEEAAPDAVRSHPAFNHA